MMKDFNRYQELILDWAKERNILDRSCAPKQRLKLMEEIGEAAVALLKNDLVGLKDAIGDICVVLIILAGQVGEKITDSNFDPDGFCFEGETDAGLLSAISYSEYTGFFYVVELAGRHNLTLIECVEAAWNEIKDRKGKTENGVFIKES